MQPENENKRFERRVAGSMNAIKKENAIKQMKKNELGKIFGMMRLSTFKSVREAPSPTDEQSHQVNIYECLPTNTQFPIEKWGSAYFRSARQ